MKKFFMLLVCLALVFPLLGCQTQTKPQLNKNAYEIDLSVGQSAVAQRFAFPAQTDFLAENKASQQQIEEYLASLIKQIRLQVWNVLFLNYFAIYSQMPNNDYVIGGDLVDFGEVEYNPSYDCVEFTLMFKSYAAWNYYHKAEDDDKQQDDGNLFLDEELSQSKFIFSQQSGGITLGQRYYDIVHSVMEEHFADIAQSAPAPQFRYDYATFHKRVHSNADITYYDGLYHHVWQQEMQDLGQEKIVEIKTVNAERGWWYLVVLCSALGVAGIGALSIFIAGKCKKSKKSKA